MSSRPSPQILQHPTHIHPLYEVDLPINVEFTCDGCQAIGCEKSYRCDHCNFDLHEYCATCPSELKSRMHKHHQFLTLVYQSGNGNICDLCEEDVEGLFYMCSFCDFCIHPLCTQIPQKLQHDHLPNHSLTLRQPRATGWCVVCHDECTSWRYRCDFCRFDFHLECVYEPFDDSMQLESPRSSRSGSMRYEQFDEPAHFESQLQSRSVPGHMGSQSIRPNAGPPRYDPLYGPAQFEGPYQSIQTRVGPFQPVWNNPPHFPMDDFHDYPVVVSNRGRMNHRDGNLAQNGDQGKRRSKRRKIFSTVAKLAANVLLGSVIGVTPFVNIDFWEN